MVEKKDGRVVTTEGNKTPYDAWKEHRVKPKRCVEPKQSPQDLYFEWNYGR